MPNGSEPIPVNLLVDVYWNLHRKMFSVKAREDTPLVSKGRVIGHFPTVTLEDAKFIVSLPKRERQIKEGRSIIHAYCRGRFVYPVLPFLPLMTKVKEITYNPYENTTWVYKETGKPVYEAKEVYLDVMLGERIPYSRITVV
jgi:hypothetical protein